MRNGSRFNPAGAELVGGERLHQSLDTSESGPEVILEFRNPALESLYLTEHLPDLSGTRFPLGYCQGAHAGRYRVEIRKLEIGVIAALLRSVAVVVVYSHLLALRHQGFELTPSREIVHHSSRVGRLGPANRRGSMSRASHRADTMSPRAHLMRPRS